MSEARNRASSVGAGGLEAFALQALALQLAGAADSLGSLAGTALGWLFEMAAQLHLAENTLALHLLLERLERLVNIVVTDENLHLAAYSFMPSCPANPERKRGESSGIPPARRRL